MKNLLIFRIALDRREFNTLNKNLLLKISFLERIIRNLHINKVIDYLIDKINFNTNEDSDICNYIIKS